MKKNAKETVKGQLRIPEWIIPVGVGLCALLLVGLTYYLTAYTNYNFLIKTQEQSLFLYTSDFFTECMQRAGGLLVYVGCFFTQFFYHPWLGSTFYAAILLLIAFLTAKAFRVPRPFLPLVFLPSFFLLWSYVDLGYLIFVLKSPGYVFSNPLGIVTALALLWAYRVIPSWIMRGTLILWVAVSYPLCGFYTLYAGVLCVLYELITTFTGEKKGRIYPAIVGLVAIGLVPYIYFVQCYTRMLEKDLYIAALPRFYFTEAELPLWMPFIWLFICLLLFLVFTGFKLGKKQKGTIWMFGISLLVYCISAWNAYSHTFQDENFRTELEMDIAASEADWNRVLEASARLEGTPTRLIVLHTNLALQKLGMAGDKMFHYKNGSQPYNSPRASRYLQNIGARPLYYYYGDANFAYRWAMEDAVENGWRVDYLKYMVRCALMNQEFPLAQKYINRLKETKYHKAWAEQQEFYAHEPRKMDLEPAYSQIKPLMEYGDVLDGDGGMIEVYLLNNFALMEGGPLELVELSLQCNLILKDIARFWPRFFLYVRNHPGRIPTHYQEAAVMYSYLEGKVDISGLPIDPDIMARFKELIRLSEEFSDKGEEYCKVAFGPSYGNTFWYYYFFVKGLKTS